MALDAGAVLHAGIEDEALYRLRAGRGAGQYADDTGHPGSRIGQPGEDVGAMYVLQVLFRALRLRQKRQAEKAHLSGQGGTGIPGEVRRRFASARV